MLSDLLAEKNKAVYDLRKKDLVNLIKEQYPDCATGEVFLFGGFEKESSVFRQENSFYYLTGVVEPGLALFLTLTGDSTLYMPKHAESRAKWVDGALEPTDKQAQDIGVSHIEYLGKACVGYQFGPFFAFEAYENVVARLRALVADKKKLFVLAPSAGSDMSSYIEQRLVLQRLCQEIAGLSDCLVDISSIIAEMRRTKDMHEVELLYKAVDITGVAHEAAAQTITEGILEADVQASLEYVMTSSGAWQSFPSIVATGKNGTTLHYMAKDGVLQKNDLVVVDIGANYNYYCADITRTYPVCGKFTKRQRELYDMVLATQEYIADMAKPGLWLSNKEKPEQSLHHLAKKFLTDRGYGEFFTHGIGHFLGMDVHDVGDYSRPLAEGDIITIEPGVYIPDEAIGIRIEDNYWIVKEGAVCLSESIVKKAEDIERLVQQNFKDGALEEVGNFEDDFEGEDRFSIPGVDLGLDDGLDDSIES